MTRTSERWSCWGGRRRKCRAGWRGTTRASARSQAQEGITNGVHVVGDVMFDASRRAAAGYALEDTGFRDGKPCSLRWIYTHMIEEYARHNGHADLIRELVDGGAGR